MLDKHTASDSGDEIREISAPANVGMSAAAQQLLNGGPPPFRIASLWEPAGEGLSRVPGLFSEAHPRIPLQVSDRVLAWLALRCMWECCLTVISVFSHQPSERKKLHAPDIQLALPTGDQLPPFVSRCPNLPRTRSDTIFLPVGSDSSSLSSPGSRKSPLARTSFAPRGDSKPKICFKVPASAARSYQSRLKAHHGANRQLEREAATATSSVHLVEWQLTLPWPSDHRTPGHVACSLRHGPTL